MKEKIIHFFVFVASAMSFFLVSWWELKLLKYAVIPQTLLVGIGIGLVLLALNALVVFAVYFVAQKLKAVKYLRAFLIPLIFWMCVAVWGAVYIGYVNGDPSRVYTVYRVCESDDRSDYCACKTDFVTKNLPYLFDYHSQYETVSVINEHVPDLEHGFRACRLKLNIKPKEKK